MTDYQQQQPYTEDDVKLVSELCIEADGGIDSDKSSFSRAFLRILAGAIGQAQRALPAEVTDEMVQAYIAGADGEPYLAYMLQAPQDYEDIFADVKRGLEAALRIKSTDSAIHRLERFLDYLHDTRNEQMWHASMILGVNNALCVLRGEPFAGFKP